MRKEGYFLLALALAAMWLAAGCAKKDLIKPEDKAKPAEAAAPVNTPVESEKYDVKKGDSLWKIASGDAAYGNAFLWPLIFKANRDQIQDPDNIEANQQLNITKDYSQAMSDDAIQKAKDTPPFNKHSEPRKNLPLMY